MKLADQNQVKELILTQGKVALVDAEDFERVSKYKWFYHFKKGQKTGYAWADRNGKTFLMHRIIMGLTNPKILSDHINRNGLDNRKQNLRACSTSDNSKNCSIYSNNSSGFKGVNRSSSKKQWVARIRSKGKSTFIGSFKTAVNAAKAYDVAALAIHGEFALTNKDLGLL